MILYRHSEKFFRLRSSIFSPSRVSSAGTPHELDATNVQTDYFLTIARVVFSALSQQFYGGSGPAVDPVSVAEEIVFMRKLSVGFTETLH